MQSLFTNIDAEKAEATNPRDKEFIFSAIRSTIGETQNFQARRSCHGAHSNP